MAKARSFQDVLAQQRSRGEEAAGEPFLTLAEALENWPAKTCAVEFFVGSRYAYAFCVLPGGEVRARRIDGADGNPLAAGELVGRASQFLSSMELRARKMYREAVSGRGFDKTWQDELYRFYLELIPDELRSSLGDCRHLVIIPHHVLHELINSTMIHFVKGESISLGPGRRSTGLSEKAKRGRSGAISGIHPYFWAVYNCGGGGHSTMELP